MSDKKTKMSELERVAKNQADAWAWQPPLPIVEAPVFVWPPQPAKALKFLFSLEYLWSVLIPFGALAAFTWVYLQPALERCIEFQADWILQMYLRNLLLIVAVARQKPAVPQWVRAVAIPRYQLDSWRRVRVRSFLFF